jgi:nicotinate-nucleotide adenylyltransferase
MKTRSRLLHPSGATTTSPLGILGGIFDPIHNGHCAAAALARDYFGLSKVYLVPAGIPAHKYNDGITDAGHRLAMVREVVKGSTSLFLWEGEIRRGGISYTIDTVHEIAAANPRRRLYFIIGSDNLSEIKTWNRYRDILAAVTLCVAHRPKYSLAVPAELKTSDIKTLPSPEWGVSSTMIRRYLAMGYSCEHLLPEGVIRYIKRHNLYKKV